MAENRDEDSHTHRSLLGDLPSLPAPTTIAEQLHAQLHRMHAGLGQAPVGVVGRSIGEGQVVDRDVDSIAHFVIGGACPALPPCTGGTRRPPAPC